MGSQGPKLSSCGQQRLWSDWADAQADAQADLSLRWVHMPFCWFYHEAAQMGKTSYSPILYSRCSTEVGPVFMYRVFFFFLLFVICQTNFISELSHLKLTFTSIKMWAPSWQNQQTDMCAQRRLRSAWASAQSDQSFSLSNWRRVGALATQRVHSEDSDQTGRMPRLIWVFAGCTATLFYHEAAQMGKTSYSPILDSRCSTEVGPVFMYRVFIFF